MYGRERDENRMKAKCIYCLINLQWGSDTGLWPGKGGEGRADMSSIGVWGQGPGSGREDGENRKR